MLQITANVWPSYVNGFEIFLFQFCSFNYFLQILDYECEKLLTLVTLSDIFQQKACHCGERMEAKAILYSNHTNIHRPRSFLFTKRVPLSLNSDVIMAS